MERILIQNFLPLQPSPQFQPSNIFYVCHVVCFSILRQIDVVLCKSHSLDEKHVTCHTYEAPWMERNMCVPRGREINKLIFVLGLPCP